MALGRDIVKEMILLFQFDKSRQQKLLRSLLPLKMRVKAVDPSDFGKPIGYLAGIQELEAETAEKAEVDAAEKEEIVLAGEMLVMAGLTSQQIDQVLAAIRRSGIGPVPYKAVLTATNQNWDAASLLAELMREHESMGRKG